MSCYVLVITLVIPFLAQAEPTKKPPFRTCNDTNAIAVGDQFTESFAIAADKSKLTGSCDNDCLQPVFVNMHKYVAAANASCYRDTHNRNKDGLELYMLMKVAMNDNAFKDFVKNGGTKCLNAKFREIIKCTGIRKTDKYDRLWKETSPFIEEQQCTKAGALKHCTLNVIREAGSETCHPSVMVFVGALFDHMAERCATLVPVKVQLPANKPPPPKSDKGNLTTHVLLGILLPVAIVAFAYVLIRDCCLPNGSWKNLTEQIAMRNRRRSLVHNEVCHDN